MQLFLLANIDVIFVNVGYDSDIDKIVDTIALDTAYKIHVIPYTPDNIFNSDDILRLDRILFILNDYNYHKRPIYIHLPKYKYKVFKKSGLDERLYSNQNIILDRSTKYYRFGKYLFTNNHTYYHRIIINQIAGGIDK